MDKRLIEVNVGHGIYVGHCETCNAGAGSTKRVLHIHRNDHPNSGCQITRDLYDTSKSVVPIPACDMELEYKDGESITNANRTWEEIENFFRNDNDCLVHCAVGQTRSPTIALIGKCVRGANVYEAVSDILGAIYRERGIVWNICLTPMKEILERYGK